MSDEPQVADKYINFVFFSLFQVFRSRSHYYSIYVFNLRASAVKASTDSEVQVMFKVMCKNTGCLKGLAMVFFFSFTGESCHNITVCSETSSLTGQELLPFDLFS